MFLYEFFNVLPSYLNSPAGGAWPLDNSIILSLIKEIVLTLNSLFNNGWTQLLQDQATPDAAVMGGSFLSTSPEFFSDPSFAVENGRNILAAGLWPAAPLITNNN